MIQCRFKIEPVAKGRPRFGRGVAFTPKKTRVFEHAVNLMAKHHARLNNVEPMQGPLEVMVMFYLTKPKTVKRDVPAVKPDLENLVKSVFDACNGVFWGDDSQIVMISCSKAYAPNQGYIDLYVKKL
jgi:Holliday junction resolvase RusA-like endonuclease